MPVEFYCAQLGPTSRGAWMTLEALGIPYTSHVLDLFKGEHKTAEFADVNPFQKVPAIADGDLKIGESRSIASYLCTKYGATNNKEDLYPQDPKAKAMVDMHLNLDLFAMDKVISYVNFAGVFRKGEKGPAADQLEAVKRVLAQREEFLSKHKFIAADHLTIADFFSCITAGLLNVTDEFPDFSAYPKVEAWMKTMSELPYYKKTCEEPFAQLKAMYREKIDSA